MSANIHNQIVTNIEELIRSGELCPGDRIPAERLLAERYGVSRNSIREALKVLAEQGIVTSRRGAGTYISEGVLIHLADRSIRRHKRLQEIFEIRKMLEPQIAALAAERIDEAAITILENLVHEQEQSQRDGLGTALLDEQYHRLLVQAAGNNVLMEIYESVHDVLAESRQSNLQSATRIRRSIERHRSLLSALRSRNQQQAMEIMTLHMHEIETYAKY